MTAFGRALINKAVGDALRIALEAEASPGSPVCKGWNACVTGHQLIKNKSVQLGLDLFDRGFARLIEAGYIRGDDNVSS